MDRISEAELFLAVVDAGGFSNAARRLGRSQSVLSRRLAALETRLGARLLERTTRRVRLTDAGERFRDRSREALALLRQAEGDALDATAAPRGRLRLSAPPSYGRACLAPLLPAFAAAYPDVELDLVLVERYVDLVAEGFDLVLRLGPLPDSSLSSRVLSIERYVLCASPAYVQRHGAPASIEEMAGRNGLVLATDRLRNRWSFTQSGRVHTVEVNGNLRTNDAGLLRQAALEGLGITALPTYLVGRDLEQGSLVEILPRAKMASFPVVAVYPSGRHLPRRVRAWIDFLVAQAHVEAGPRERRTASDSRASKSSRRRR